MAPTSKAAAEAARQKIAAVTAATMRNLHDPDREHLADDAVPTADDDTLSLEEIEALHQGSNAPTEPVVALVRPPSTGASDAAIAANIVELARQAELEHFTDAYSYQVKTVTKLTGLLAEATRQLLSRDLVAPSTRAAIRQQIDGWDIQGGIDNARGDGA